MFKIQNLRGKVQNDVDDDDADEDDDEEDKRKQGVLSTENGSKVPRHTKIMSKKSINMKRATLLKLRERLKRGADQEVAVLWHNSPGGLPTCKIDGHNSPGGLPKQADGEFQPATASGNIADRYTPCAGCRQPVYRCCRERARNKDEEARQRRQVQSFRNLFLKTLKKIGGAGTPPER